MLAGWAWKELSRNARMRDMFPGASVTGLKLNATCGKNSSLWATSRPQLCGLR